MASKQHHPQSRGGPLAAQRHACRGWSELSLHFLGVTHVLTGQLVSSQFRSTRSIGEYPHREEGYVDLAFTSRTHGRKRLTC